MSTEGAIRMDELIILSETYGVQNSTVTKYIVEHFPEEVWSEGNDILYYVSFHYRDGDPNISQHSIVNALKKLLLKNYDTKYLVEILSEFIMEIKSEICKIIIVLMGVELWKKIACETHWGWICDYTENIQYNFMKLILKTNGTSIYNSILETSHYNFSPKILELKNRVCTNRKAAIALIGLKKRNHKYKHIDRYIFREIAIALWAEI